jgi:hypothetical protein
LEFLILDRETGAAVDRWLESLPSGTQTNPNLVRERTG